MDYGVKVVVACMRSGEEYRKPVSAGMRFTLAFKCSDKRLFVSLSCASLPKENVIDYAGRTETVSKKDLCSASREIHFLAFRYCYSVVSEKWPDMAQSFNGEGATGTFEVYQ